MVRPKDPSQGHMTSGTYVIEWSDQPGERCRVVFSIIRTIPGGQVAATYASKTAIYLSMVHRHALGGFDTGHKPINAPIANTFTMLNELNLNWRGNTQSMSTSAPAALRALLREQFYQS